MGQNVLSLWTDLAKDNLIDNFIGYMSISGVPRCRFEILCNEQEIFYFLDLKQ